MKREAYTSASIRSSKQNQNNSWISEDLSQLEDYIEDSISQRVFVFQTDPQIILDIFQSSAYQLQVFPVCSNYNLIQKQQFHCTIIKNQPRELSSIWNCCRWFIDTPVTAIKIVITKNVHTAKKICKLRGLVGSVSEIQNFFAHFEKKTMFANKSSITVIQQPQQNNHEQYSNPFQLQACTMYYVAKQLNNSNTQLGCKLAKQFADFKSSFKNVKQSADLLPAPMSNILTMINQIDAQICVKLSKSKRTKEFIHYSRISIQRYIFDSLQGTLLPIYSFRNKQSQDVFEEKTKKIFTEYNTQQILQQISMNKKFWFLPQHMLPDKTTKKQLVTMNLYQQKYMGYQQACKSLAKIQITSSPRQKIKFVQQSYAKMKTAFFQNSNRQEELLIMEDIIPATILLILISDILELRTQIDLMKDFLQSNNNSDLQSERRIIINLSESFFYITRDWKI